MNKFKMLIISLISMIITVMIVAAILILIYLRKPWTIIGIISFTYLLDMIFGAYILNSHRHVTTKACWLFVILLLPGVGCLFFVIFGTLPMKRKSLEQKTSCEIGFNRFEDYTYTNEITNNPQVDDSLFLYSYNCDCKPIYKNNQIRLIHSNSLLYEEMIKTIRSAKKFIHLETYIIHDGFYMRTIFAELIQQAKKGIKIRFLYDWYGSFKSKKYRQIRELKKAGIEVGVFNPAGFNIFKGATNYRLHRKALVVDNQTAIYGGSNISDEYLAVSHQKYYWSDYNFVITGEIVNSININFIHDWIDFTDRTVKSHQKANLEKEAAGDLKIHKSENIMKMQLVKSSPNYMEKGIMNTMCSLFLKAKHSIKLVTPYFLPTELALSTLLIASRSGIDVQVIVPGKRDNKDFVLPMNRSQYAQLLACGVKVYEFDGFIHSKYILIDDRYVLISSANFDYRSMWINFENGILIDSIAFNKALSEVFSRDLHNSRLVTSELIKTQSALHVKIIIALINFYKPLL